VRELAREFAEFLAAVHLTRAPGGGETVSPLGRHVLSTVRVQAAAPRAHSLARRCDRLWRHRRCRR
jgi:hypothetical protein